MARAERPRRVFLSPTRRAIEALQQTVEHNHKLLHKILEGMEKMSKELDRIVSETAEIKGSIDSAIALLEKLAQLIRDNVGNPAALTKIADDLDASGNALAAAVVANDPDNPDPTPASDPEAGGNT